MNLVALSLIKDRFLWKSLSRLNRIGAKVFHSGNKCSVPVTSGRARFMPDISTGTARVHLIPAVRPLLPVQLILQSRSSRPQCLAQSQTSEQQYWCHLQVSWAQERAWRSGHCLEDQVDHVHTPMWAGPVTFVYKAGVLGSLQHLRGCMSPSEVVQTSVQEITLMSAFL